jgi:uncharacterized circularly permuted ATP-grasp superfamily protein/uncharacterized alpha-E superfamily protein
MAQAEIAASAVSSSLCHDYRPKADTFDEMCLPDGSVRPHWDYLSGAVEQLGHSGLQGRWREARRLIRDNGVTYNLFGDPDGMSRPWELDLIPLLITSEEWSGIERGLIQRAELLNLLLLDLYGPRKLVGKGLLPPDLVYGPHGLRLPCDGIQSPMDLPLVFYSADLARQADGSLRVVGDRTQAPAGAGYALENRIVLTRVLPSLFRDSHVHRLAGFFRAVRKTLRALAPKPMDSPRVVLLTPGPRNPAYFEHAYLANYLGYTLAQGDDLTVRDGALWIKTLNGLEPVHVVLRRVEDDWCDPLEMRGDSLLGVPGLLQAVRAGNVTLANALGSAILEHPALEAYLPAISRQVLGEDLYLPGVGTWWCGDPDGLGFVLDNLPRLVIKRCCTGDGRQCLFGDELSQQELTDLKLAIRAEPGAFVGQEMAGAATTPVYEDGRLVPRTSGLRTFLVAEDDSYTVMPGGLTRVALDDDRLAPSSRLGGLGKDTWVLASEPERDESLLAAKAAYSPAVQVSTEVSSRVADNLFWIGRYAERAEGLVRLLRIIVLRSGDRLGEGRGFDQVRTQRLLLQTLTHQTLTYPGFVGEDSEPRLAHPEPELMSLLTELGVIGGLPQTLQALGNAAWSVRDRLSMDTWRVVNAIDDQLQALTEGAGGGLVDVLDELDPLITALVAFSGLTRENMTHNDGWHFLEIGHRLERAVNTTILLTNTLIEDSGEDIEALLAEAVLGVTDSLITYRRRYQSGTRVGALLDLVLQDEANPRSLAFQLVALERLVAELPRPEGSGGGRTRAEKLLLDALTRVRLADIDQLANSATGEDWTRSVLAELLQRIGELMPLLSDELTALYFRHEDRPHSLLAPR